MNTDDAMPASPGLTKRRSTDDYLTQKERLNAADDVANVGKALAEAGLIGTQASSAVFALSTWQHQSEKTLATLHNEAGEVVSEGSGEGFQAASVRRFASTWREFAAAKTSGYIVNRDDHNNTIIQSTDFDDKHDDHKHDCDFKSTLPDTKEWMEVLLEQQAHGTQFTDVEQFPPKESSLVVHLAEDDVKGTYRRTIYTCTRTSTRALSC